MSSQPGEQLVMALDSADAELHTVGGKGASLARLARAGLPVPPGFHVTTAAYRHFIADNGLSDRIVAEAQAASPDDPATLERASTRIAALITQATMPAPIAAAIEQTYRALGADTPVAVRSSATAEDLPELSFAGQQDSFLNLRGTAEVLDAVQRCWASLWTARAIGYRARHGIPSPEVSLAVVVQQLVPAEVAGILFTANPLTGARHQSVINAAWGLGEAIVGGLVTPDTLVVDRVAGTIVTQEIADKAVMTVPVAGGTREQPVPEARRGAAALSAAQAVELARQGDAIEQLYGMPMDIEWTLHDGRIAIVQARPITALSEPRATLAWDVLRPGGQYARSSVIELLPEPLSPLFTTLALPLWNEAMNGLMRDIGFGDAFRDMKLVTINDYAYYDYGMSAAQSAQMITTIPRLLNRLGPWLGSSRTRWADDARPRYAAVVQDWAARDLGSTSAADLLEGAGQITRLAARHYVAIQSGILPVAYMSEALFTGLYNRLARHDSDPPALSFMLGFDSAPIAAEKSLYDLATWAREQPALRRYLEARSADDVVGDYHAGHAPIDDADAWREFSRRLDEHLRRFGHAVYDLDFAKSLPADDPAPLIQALAYFVSGAARSPYERQIAARQAREQAAGQLLQRVRGLRLPLLKLVLEAAQRYAPLREDALADVGLGWPILRRMLLEVGNRLVAAGAISDRDDVFWMELLELQAAAAALDAGQVPQRYHQAVAERHARWRRERAATPPVTLPIRGGARFLGFDFSGLMPAHTDQDAGDTIRGIGASPGRVAGVARVIHGPAEFREMRQGDILVTKITTPAWTPLFALASGVVTDVGGPLSHSSIVAREYHIPAVLGTGVATERIHSDRTITVDGDGGLVYLEH